MLYERTRDVVRTLPGVDDAALSVVTPVGGITFDAPVSVSGGVPLPERERVIFGNVISTDWFTTFGMRVSAGRDFTVGDRNGAPQVAIVNQAFARTLLNGANPIGHTVALPASLFGTKPMEIVGVAEDAVYVSLREPLKPTLYLPLAQRDEPFFLPGFASMNLSVRAHGGPPTRLVKSIAAAISAVDPHLTLTFSPLADQVSASVNQERIVAMLSASFGVLALLLAALGLYGVTAYSVAQRRLEIGIRMALGAAPAGVVRLVLYRVSWMLGVGVVVGVGVSLWASKFVATLLYGLRPRDPATLVLAAVTLVLVGTLAGWLPARRASRFDPAEVLREG